jgi:hypothetical protein
MQTEAEEIRKLLDRIDAICQKDWAKLLEEIKARPALSETLRKLKL